MPNLLDPITTYLVVPLKGAATERTVKCQYFREEKSEWISVPPDNLRSLGHDLVCVRQPPYEEAVKVVPDADRCLQLFAGVAKTRNADYCMPKLMQCDDGAIMVPVFPKSKRSLILIFQRCTSDSEFGELVATTDPEIHNGTDGLPGDGGDPH